MNVKVVPIDVTDMFIEDQEENTHKVLAIVEGDYGGRMAVVKSKGRTRYIDLDESAIWLESSTPENDRE